MKHSISRKIFMIVSGMIISVILLYLLINSLAVESYYISTKQETLKSVYNYINSQYNKNIDFKDMELELDRIDANKNVNIVIYDSSNNEIYISGKNFIKPYYSSETIEIDKNTEALMLNYTFKKKICSCENYEISLHSDKKLKSDFIILSGKLDNGYYVIIRMSVESIQESVRIYNRLLIMISFVTVILSAIITYILSKRFTKPILELSEIAQSMSNLDFSKKYNAKTNDEIGTLGKSINSLSGKLETTINKLKKSNSELERDIEEKSKIDEMRKQFISDVSHELKTPIALIQGYAEGLQENVVKDEESKQYYCSIILDEAEKMNKLVMQLLTLSKLEYGNEEVRKQEFNLTKLIDDILKKFSVILSEKQINVDFTTKNNIYVNADEFMIDQVVSNYLNNAVNHISGDRKIDIELLRNENKVRVTVFNTGENIPEEELYKIWNRFYKADKSRNREAGGTGIGLSLVKAIISKHDNKYGVENRENGVAFWFELDVAE